MAEKQAPTHGAYALRRESKLRSRWIEIGHARIEPCSRCKQANIEKMTDGVHHIFLDRLPIGGFTGHVYLSPIGAKPPEPEAQPERPLESDNQV